MTIELKWHVPDKVILVSSSGTVDTEIIAENMKTVLSWIESSNEPMVHILIDSRKATFSTDAMRIKQRMDAVRSVLSHERCGWVLMIGDGNPVGNFIASTVTQIFKVRFRTMKTMDEALEFLVQTAPNIETIPEIPE